MAMRQKILHTPEGVKDIYGKECRKKLLLQEELHEMLHLYGYEDIQTPAFEFLEVFGRDTGIVSSRELYKFFDREGNTLALRPDITPSVARVAVTQFEKDSVPLRMCYIGNTFLNHGSQQGELCESTQLGAELIGDGTAGADAELIALAADSLKRAGMKEFQISVGHVEFLQSLLDAAQFPAEVKEKVRTMIARRNFLGMRELLEKLPVKRPIREVFYSLPELVGSVEILNEARELAPDRRAILALERLKEVYEILKLYHMQEMITFDLGMCGKYAYYSGMIFKSDTFGGGEPVAKGGRYDRLMERFGRELPAAGFAIGTDELMKALIRQKIQIPEEPEQIILLFDREQRKYAISLAKEFRGKGKRVELLEREEKKNLSVYHIYGRRKQAGSLIYLRRDEQIIMVNLHTGEKKVVDCA